MHIEQYKMEKWFEKYSHCMFNLSGSGIPTVSVYEDIGTISFSYQNPKGREALLEKIESKYEIDNLHKKCIITNGASEAYYLFCRTTLKPGDSIVVFKPCFQLLDQIPKMMGVEVIYIDIFGKLKKQLDQLRHTNIKAVVINSPHNPTGIELSDDQICELIYFAKKLDAYVIFDEVYSEASSTSKYLLENAYKLYKNCVSVGSFSKSYGLPGLRVGWIATTNDHLCKNLLHLKEYISYSTSSCSQSIVDHILISNMTDPQDWRKIASENYGFLIARGQEYFVFSKYSGGYTCFPKFSNAEISSSHFCEFLAKEKSVFILPGIVFDFDSHIRINLAIDKISFSKAINILIGELQICLG